MEKGKKYGVGKLLEYPEITTQGETLEELEENMNDAYRLVAMEDVPEHHEVRELALRSDSMDPSVKEVTPRDDYMLFVVFENGESGILDMKQILDFGIFHRIKDYDAFRRVRVAFDTIEWEAGVDLDPEFVYEKCKGTRTAQQKPPADT